ncbi:hypothetical protein BFP72_08975 [Reichenbachiella sp. 5M10]|uniref:DUF4625 domain-containing protein n=1 Tax=Reichenbachiella sp. 5M10 TaxID=1889772 RepID=UPI000C15AA5B|nr:DUF4625 domain-containing protein [Reichenbachiella sp. 5M10]PIB35513.1 hypothetical protein BFP72_08975 [Reichenbachiella sp. 5M10]
MKKNFWIALFAVTMISACESDDNTPDLTAPVIEMEEPFPGDSFAAGWTMHVLGEITDDEGLASYNITIHDDFDGHTHGRVLEAFSYDQSFVASGTMQEIDQEIEITETATAGPYHFVVQAIDEAGNTTSFADGSTIESEIWITNDEMALIHFEDANGTEVDEYEAELGVSLAFYGHIEDQEGALDHVDIQVGHVEESEEHDHSHERVLEDAIYDEEFEVEGATSVTIESLLANANIVVTQSDLDALEEGEHLYLIITVKDEDGNYSKNQIAIHFD